MVERRPETLDDQPHDPERTTYRRTFDWSSPDQPTVALVETLAEIHDADPAEIDPVATHLDTDALDALFDRQNTGSDPGCVAFTIDDHRISITGDGRIVAEADASDSGAEDAAVRRPADRSSPR